MNDNSNKNIMKDKNGNGEKNGNGDKKIIYQNEFFTFFIINRNVYLKSKPKEIQELYEKSDNDEKLKKFDELIDYFYNYWKIVELEENNYKYIMNFDINLVMINIPLDRFLKIKAVLESLKNVIEKKLEKTYIKVDNNLTKHFFDLILNFYKPIKEVIII